MSRSDGTVLLLDVVEMATVGGNFQPVVLAIAPDAPLSVRKADAALRPYAARWPGDFKLVTLPEDGVAPGDGAGRGINHEHVSRVCC